MKVYHAEGGVVSWGLVKYVGYINLGGGYRPPVSRGWGEYTKRYRPASSRHPVVLGVAVF